MHAIQETVSVSGGGAHFGGGHFIRPRIDGVFYPSGERNGATQKATDLSLGSDYLYFLGGKSDGLYLIGGLSVHQWKFEETIPASGTGGIYPAFSGSKNSTSLGYSLGVGYNFNRTVGVEGRFVNSKYKTSFDVDHNVNSLQAGITVRF